MWTEEEEEYWSRTGVEDLRVESLMMMMMMMEAKRLMEANVSKLLQ